VTSTTILILIATGLLAGTSNALVGGGTLFSFPILVAVGMPPVTAVTTNMTALWPGLVTSAYAYLPEIKRAREGMGARVAVALAGGLVGAVLLLMSGEKLFSTLVPWLLATGTILFTFAKPIVGLFIKSARQTRALGPLLVMEFFCAIYGSYFTAGIGIMLQAAMALAGETNVQSANAQRNFLVCFITGIAVVIYIAMGQVDWLVAPILMAGSIAGGYIGAKVVRHIPAGILRVLITLAGATFAVVDFIKVYG
jgi:uncharacterized protein